MSLRRPANDEAKPRSCGMGGGERNRVGDGLSFVRRAQKPGRGRFLVRRNRLLAFYALKAGCGSVGSPQDVIGHTVARTQRGVINHALRNGEEPIRKRRPCTAASGFEGEKFSLEELSKTPI